MNTPPPPPKRDPDDLAEVERALSVLKGRHPDHERIRRQDEARLADRRAKQDDESRVEQARARTRTLKIGAASIVGVGVLGLLLFFFRSEVVRRGRIEQAGDPYRAMGFVVIQTSSRGSPGILEETVEPGCLLAVSTTEAKLEIGVGGAKIAGPAPALFCTCVVEKIRIAAPITDRTGGLALLRAPSVLVGGTHAFAFAPLKAATIGKTDEPCADASFDAWLEAGQWPKPTIDDAKVHPALKDVGFASVAVVKKDVPFAVVEMPAESCLLATSNRPEDTIALRIKGIAGRGIEAKQSIGWCAAPASLAIVEREGSGEVSAIVAPAKRVGGLLGLREASRAAGIEIMRARTPSADRGWDARAALIASSVPEALVAAANTPSIKPELEARIAAVSFGSGGALTPETPPDTYSYCEPALDANVTEAVCAFSAAATWRLSGGDAIGGVGRAKLPFWLFPLQNIDDPAALKVTTQLLALARGLRRAGFEPTTLEAMTEQQQGVEVLGRTGEDAVVAIMLAGTAPYVFPLTEQTPWQLGQEPPIAKVAPLAKIVLKTNEKKLPPMAGRRTVVFRRKAK